MHNVGPVEIPIACSLTETEARNQVEEWQDLLAAAVVEWDRISPTDLALRLVDGPGQLGSVVCLAQREKACCPFFDFAIRIDADSLWLTISVPAEAAPILDQFLAAVGC